jgi:phenylpropionate dioxygenase-like ring-hydroxylating dioxygenase large terminal subunit
MSRSEVALEPRHYADPAWAEAERERLFARGWQFVAFTDDLSEHNRFLTRLIAGVPVLVQNFDGEIRAFRNICSHRFARIHGAEQGRSLLRCPYHGWTYNADGVPIGIPRNEECFGLDRAAREGLALKRYEVAAAGRFVFVRLEPGGPDLETSLGDHAGLLRDLSDGFDAPFAGEAMEWACDWKIGVENVLEVYHVDSVHPETFRTVAEGAWDCDASGPHSRGRIGLTAENARWWEGMGAKLKLLPLAGLAPYHHLLLFPNLALSVTAGRLLSVQTYEPAGPGRTVLRWRLALAKAQPGASAAARNAVAGTLADFNRTVLSEDRAICQETQIGTAAMDRPALLGRNEERIRAFHAAWRAAMS